MRASAAAYSVTLLGTLAGGRGSASLLSPEKPSIASSVKTETFRSFGRGPHQADDMVRITVDVKRGPKADRIKRAIQRVLKSL